MSCEPEKVTALVDGALPPDDAASVEAHVAECAGCRALASSERAVHERLRALPRPEMPPGLETRLRAALRSESPRRFPSTLLRAALPIAAAIALVLWARGLPAFVAWELANDHGHCFSSVEPPARVRSSEPATVGAWFAARGTALPALPGRAGSARLFGGRYCYFPDVSAAPHVYYTGSGQPLSIFVLAHAVRFGEAYGTLSRGRRVELVRVGNAVVGVVSADAAEVDDAVRQLRAEPQALQALLGR